MTLKSNVDAVGFDPESLDKDQVEVIPEGKQLFSIYNMWFGRYNGNPRGKRRSTDFSIPFNVQYSHIETGLLITALNNGADDPFNRMLFLKVVGEIDTRGQYYKFMQGIKAPPHKVKGMGNAVRYHSMQNGDRVFMPHDDPDNPGPLGLPVKLTIVHKEVPVLTHREGAEKNRYGRYEKEDLIQVIDDGKPVTRVKEFIEVDHPQSDDFVERMMAGWPVISKLTPAEEKQRGEYYIAQAEEEETEQETTKEKDEDVDW
jgi:hypothetical protein